MTFKVFVHPSLLVKIPAERKEHIKSAIKELINRFRIVTDIIKNSKEPELLHTGLELAIIGFSINLMKKKRKCTFSIF